MRTSITVSLLCVLSLIFTLGHVAVAEPESPVVAEKDGNVTVNGYELRQGDRLSEGDVVSSAGEDTNYLDLEFRTGGRIRLKGASVKIKSLDPGIKLDLRKGLIFSATGQSERSKSLRIRTKHSVAGVRGTKFFIQAKPDQTYVCVCEGSVWVRKHGLASYLWGGELVVPEGHDAHVYEDKQLPESSPNDRMVKQTWREFKDMGYEVPAKFRR